MRTITLHPTVVDADAFAPFGVLPPDEGDGRTFAEMPPAEKHALSHRGPAFRALAAALRTHPS